MNKPYPTTDGSATPSGLSERTAGKVAEQIAGLVARMGDRFPSILLERPGEPCKPFAIGITESLRARCASAAERNLMYGLAARLTRRTAYIEALAAPGAMRHDPDGRPVESVSAEARQFAKRRLGR